MSVPATSPSRLFVGGIKLLASQSFQICFSPLVDSFLKTKLSKDRREAPPLPLWVLFQWERRVLQSAATVYETLMLGAFLLITWAGLRFADAQRLNVDSLVFNFQELRGLVWRSKTMASGHPFGGTSCRPMQYRHVHPAFQIFANMGSAHEGASDSPLTM